MAKYKVKCGRCKKNYVLASWRTRFPICYDCQKGQMVGEIKDPKMKKLLNISEEYYKKSTFLCDIKIKYLQFGNLTENQIEAFKKAIEKLDEDEKSTSKSKT